jgi:hypothetical protein
MPLDTAGFAYDERVAVLHTAGAANLFYTLGGVVLMLYTPDLPRLVRIAMRVTWISGVGMTAAALFGHVAGMVASTALLFPSLIAWTSWMGRHWRRK